MVQSIRIFETLPTWVWETTFLLASLCLVFSLALLFLRRLVPRFVTGLLQVCLAVILVTIVADLGYRTPDVDNGIMGWLHVIAVAATAVALFELEPIARKWNFSARFSTLVRPAVLITMSALGLLGSTWRFHEHAYEEMSRFGQANLPMLPSIIAVPEAVAVTDSGRSLPLYRFEVPDDATLSSAETLGNDIGEKVIVSESDEVPTNSNCHGWVFTDGHYFIGNDLVDLILKENGYQLVEEPDLGDLIIYRDEQGLPIHTGIVKAIGKDHFVLVESKWGGMPVYLHRPLDQVYSTHYAYYHSPRDSHRLHIETRDGTMSGASAPQTTIDGHHLSGE